MCELHNLYILHGINSPATFTCHTSRGESTVDYILCNKLVLQIKHIPLKASNITDHDLLTARLPMQKEERTPPPDGQPTCVVMSPSSSTEGPQATQRVGHPRNTAPADATEKYKSNRSYKWIEGKCLREYNTSATKWKQHTSTHEFTESFQQIMQAHAEDNELRTDKIETFLLDEAIAAGVMTVTTKRTS